MNSLHSGAGCVVEEQVCPVALKGDCFIHPVSLLSVEILETYVLYELYCFPWLLNFTVKM